MLDLAASPHISQEWLETSSDGLGQGCQLGREMRCEMRKDPVKSHPGTVQQSNRGHPKTWFSVIIKVTIHHPPKMDKDCGEIRFHFFARE